jgi:tight adherence protein C
MSLTASIQRVVKRSQNQLAEHLNDVLGEMRAGKTFADAMRSMTETIGLGELTSAVQGMVLAHQRGGSTIEILLNLSRNFERSLHQQAEKRANKLPMLLLAPLFICILPPTLLALFFPIAYQLSAMF